MNKKITPILLATALMLSPMSQVMTSYATDDEKPKEEVVQTIDNQKAGEDFKVELDNGEEISSESVTNTDVKEVGETDVKLIDSKGNDVQVEKVEEIKNEKTDKQTDKQTNKDKNKEDKLPEAKVDEVKNTSKPVYNEMKIVREKDDDQDANFITVVSNSSDNKPLTGFKYKLINTDTNKELDLDFTSESEIMAKVPDGNYTIKFISGPEKYGKEEDVKFAMPLQDENKKDEYTRQTKVMLKHTLTKEKVTDNPKTMDDRNFLVPILLSIAGLGVIGYIVYRRREEIRLEK